MRRMFKVESKAKGALKIGGTSKLSHLKEKGIKIGSGPSEAQSPEITINKNENEKKKKLSVDKEQTLAALIAKIQAEKRQEKGNVEEKQNGKGMKLSQNGRNV